MIKLSGQKANQNQNQNQKPEAHGNSADVKEQLK